jgi:hypothetical protein
MHHMKRAKPTFLLRTPREIPSEKCNMLGCWSELVHFVHIFNSLLHLSFLLGVGAIGVPYLQLFFYSFLCEFGSYSLHIACFGKILKHHIICFIFASKYLHRCAYKYSIWCKSYILHGIFISEQIFAIVTYWQIFFTSKYLFISEYSQNLRRISHWSK